MSTLSAPRTLYVANEFKELQSRREALEGSLKSKIAEFRELCLREGELTGQLPIDYPLQPREPIPQVRRRIRSHNSNQNYRQQVLTVQCQGPTVLTNQIKNAPFLPPSRPTSTSSSNSSTSNSISTQATNNGSSDGYWPQKQIAQPIPVSQPAVNHLQLLNLDGTTKFQPYYEESKPFQMSDFYKYSSKHRTVAPSETIYPVRSSKSTRQLQEDVSNNPLRYSSCDDQIQASVRLIERSGQKLIQATAKAIAGNPSLAEKLTNILPKHVERY